MIIQNALTCWLVHVVSMLCRALCLVGLRLRCEGIRLFVFLDLGVWLRAANAKGYMDVLCCCWERDKSSNEKRLFRVLKRSGSRLILMLVSRAVV